MIMLLLTLKFIVLYDHAIVKIQDNHTVVTIIILLLKFKNMLVMHNHVVPTQDNCTIQLC